MTTEELKTKIKAHIIEFPNDKSKDISELFGVSLDVIYDLREYLRRHGVLPRHFKNQRKKPRTYVRKDVVVNGGHLPTEIKAAMVASKEESAEVVSLKAEITRLKVIVSYLEGKK